MDELASPWNWMSGPAPEPDPGGETSLDSLDSGRNQRPRCRSA